jgi:hypothetical protein
VLWRISTVRGPQVQIRARGWSCGQPGGKRVARSVVWLAEIFVWEQRCSGVISQSFSCFSNGFLCKKSMCMCNIVASIPYLCQEKQRGFVRKVRKEYRRSDEKDMGVSREYERSLKSHRTVSCLTAMLGIGKENAVLHSRKDTSSHNAWRG